MISFPQRARVEGGKLVILNTASWRASLARLDGQEVTVTVETESSRRSSQANRYYWGVVVAFFREIWSRGRVEAGLPPYTKDETHSVLVQVLVGSDPGPLPGSSMPKPTRTMPSDVFAKLTNDARQLAWDEYQVSLPSPDEPPEVTL